MALRRGLSQRICHTTLNRPPIYSPFAAAPSFPKPPSINSDSTNTKSEFPAENGFFRRFLQKRALAQSALSSFAIGDKLMEKLKGMNLNQHRLQLGGLTPPTNTSGGISVSDAKKLLKIAQLEKLKSTFRMIPRNTVSYSEYVQICVDNSSSRDLGFEFAKMLDECGAVIVINGSVFLRPEQITKALEAVIPSPTPLPDDPRRRELEMMEKEKAIIDKKANVLVRRELWGGLGFLMFQTAGFVRLTFWELSWDVMEPICFYLTSIYFMASYAFFLRTSTEPSFEGFFQNRFQAKQKRLMKTYKFDLERFDELKKACDPLAFEQQASKSSASASASASCCNSEGQLVYSMHR